MTKRAENERKYKNWDELPDGGRRYWYDSPGRRVKGFARYIKMVDANEVTLSFVQEIYDEHGRLVAVHRKFPVDVGHQQIVQDEDDKER